MLPPETARLIAAGEVIDRPAAVLREFLDNALDAGAREVRAEIEGGGAALVRVVDDGTGMAREDLELSILPHATSKIEKADDLLSARTLGFRGEALPSIAAAARLEITSRVEEAREAWKLVAGPGSPPTIQPVPGNRGTTIQATRLFDDYPARKQFLKRAQGEAAACRQVFVDKALAHPDIGMRYSSEGRLSLNLGPESQEARVLALFEELPRDLVYRVRFSASACEGSVVLASPGFYRNDRRLLQAFVNRRRVQDSGLIQALDYAFSGFLPGGAHPAAFLFAEVDPAFADFNIHPAKREVRFKDAASLRHGFTQAIRAFLLELSRRAPEKARPSVAGSFEFGTASGGEEAFPSGDYAPKAGAYAGYGPGQGASRAGARQGGFASASAAGPSPAWKDFAGLRERLPERPYAAAETASGPSYLGTVFGLFLVAQDGDALYLIDQHAAHERHLFDTLSAAPPVAQELLVPAVYEPEDEAEAARLEAAAEELSALGFHMEKEGSSWLVTSLPSPLDRDPVGAVREILDMMGGGHGTTGPQRGARHAALATMACRAAVKDGDALDAEAAADLVRLALALEEPRCPHGRPVWVRITREELFRLVRRLV